MGVAVGNFNCYLIHINCWSSSKISKFLSSRSRYVDHKVCVPEYEEKCTPKLETKCTTKNKEECKEVYKDQCKINYKGQSVTVGSLGQSQSQS